MKRTGLQIITVPLLIAITASLALADWPTYQHDNRRSGITDEQFLLPLENVWTYQSPSPPQTAWPGPAKWDSYANIRNLRSMRDFDPVFFVTSVGNSVFFGSSADDAAHCLDTATGDTKWVFPTDGPVRLPPTYYEGNVYFGSDDGYAYCVNAETGDLVWSYKPAPSARMFPSNGKMISPWPCRTGVMIQNGRAYFAASLLPWSPSYLCAVDAKTGSDQGDGMYKATLEAVTMQGAFLASDTKLYTSQGRQEPQVYDLSTGSFIGSVGNRGDGGCYAILTDDGTFIQGRGQNHDSFGELRGFSAEDQDNIATFPQANCMVIKGNIAYLHTQGTLSAFDRERNLRLQGEKIKLQALEEKLKKAFKKLKDPRGETDKGKKLLEDLANIDNDIKKLDADLEKGYVWQTDSPYLHTMILAGEILFTGSENQVEAYNSATGEKLWSAEVQGNVEGLTADNGRLYACTDLGHIACFVHKASE